MKKIFLTVAAVFALSFANAQDAKETTGGMGFSNGDVYLTGTAGFSSTKTGDIKTDGFTLAPGVGYFVSDNLAIEGMLSYTSTTDSNTDAFPGAEVKDSGFGIGAGVRYYFTPASQFSVSLGGNVTYQSIKREVEVISGDATKKVIGLNIPVGLNYFVSNDFALTAQWAGFGYSS